MTIRVTLNGINRRGLANWKARESWLYRRVRIWSAEHAAWWRPDGNGYTIRDDEAGVYDFADAHDGPAPMWKGWAILEAFLAGIEYARKDSKSEGK